MRFGFTDQSSRRDKALFDNGFFVHHPGPPRFVSIGDSVELAPWYPDPDGNFEWDVVESPAKSGVDVGEDPVVVFKPDVPGQYLMELNAPEGRHELTVRAFPDNSNPISIELPTDKIPGERADVNRILEDLGPQEDIAQYVNAEGPGRPRVRLTATQNDETIVVQADPKASPRSKYDDHQLDVEFYLDDRDDVPLDVEGRKAQIPANSIEDVARVHAVAVGERHSVADQIRLIRNDKVRIERPNDPPDWAIDATIYEIYIRAFASDDVETTFKEVKKRIPYLNSLGIDCVWFTPVLETTSSSGYQVQDYFETASDLGTREEFESLVESLHESDIKVMFDLVINHSGFNHVPFQMSAADVEEYRDWYNWDENGDYEFYFDWDHLPNFNYHSLEVREYLHSIVDEWAAVVDGFRCDVAWGTPHGFWKEVRERVKSDHPEFLLLDEVIPRDAQYHESEFDLHHDTRLFNELRRIGQGTKPGSHLLDVVQTPPKEGFPEHAIQMRFVENHDFERYAEECSRSALKTATAAILTLPGVPMIYYGQERGVEGSWENMTWSGGDTELTNYHRQLIQLRNEQAVLRRGDFIEVDWQSDDSGVVAYGRTDGETQLIVALNFDDEEATIHLNESVKSVDLISGDTLDTGAGSDFTRLSVKNAVVLRSE